MPVIINSRGLVACAGTCERVLLLCCYCFSIEDCSSAFNTVISADLGFNVSSRSGLCAGSVIVFALDDGGLDNHIILILDENQWLMAFYSMP